jgi:hypothetical protein
MRAGVPAAKPQLGNIAGEELEEQVRQVLEEGYARLGDLRAAQYPVRHILHVPEQDVCFRSPGNLFARLLIHDQARRYL